MSVDILLATYNGDRFLATQLESLINQSYSDIRIVIGDDGSTDNTLSIVTTFATRYPDRLFLLPSSSRQGACKNFCRLLASTTAPHVLLADQDDIWDVDKVAVSMETMLKLERQHGERTPLLVHSDLRIIDAQQNLVSRSFIKFQRLNKHRAALSDLLFQNVVTGCTTLMNRALIEKALPIPHQVIMHDWWLAIVASTFGHIHFIDRPLVSYRQHSNNVVGAKGWSASVLKNRIMQLTNRRQAANLGYPVISQARAFSAQFSSELSPAARKMAHRIGGLDQCSGLTRIRHSAGLRARKHGILRTIALYWLLIRADFAHLISIPKK